MNKSRFALLGIAAIAVSAFAIAQDAVKIAWKPVAGSVMKYRVVSNGDFGGQASEFGATLTVKVTELKPDGKVVTKTSSGDVSLKVGGQDMSSMVPPMDFTITTVQTPDGETVSRELDKPSEFDSPRMENGMVFIYPKSSVKVGDTWTRNHPGDKAKGIPASVATFTYRGTEKVGGKFDAHKISVVFKESTGDQPMTVEGTYWIKVEDGALLKGENDMKNVEIMPGMIVNMKNKIDRIES